MKGFQYCEPRLFQVCAGDGKKGKGKGGKWKNMMKKCHDDEINTEEAFKGFKECKEENKKEEKTEEEERRRRRSPSWGGGGGKGGKWGKQNMVR